MRLTLLLELLLLQPQQIQIRPQAGCEEDLCRNDLLYRARGNDEPEDGYDPRENLH